MVYNSSTSKPVYCKTYQGRRNGDQIILELDLSECWTFLPFVSDFPGVLPPALDFGVDEATGFGAFTGVLVESSFTGVVEGFFLPLSAGLAALLEVPHADFFTGVISSLVFGLDRACVNKVISR